MSKEVASARIQHRGMTKQEWESSSDILMEREIGIDMTTGYPKVGDGKNKFKDLKDLRGPMGPQGPSGERGLTGPIGPRGPAGKPGTTDYNQLQNKPNLDAFAQKKETNSKITKLESSKADKSAVYSKAESKIELDKKLSLTGGIVTGQLQFKPNKSGIKPSSSVGGAINIDMSKSEGAGVVVYSNNDTSDGPLMSLRTGKETFNKSALFVDYKGTTNAVNIVMRQPTTPNFSSALNITSDNENGSAMQLRGSEKALGTLKITHENPNVEAKYDENATALSIDIVKKQKGGKGTAAQGIYINSTSGTTGKLLRIRNLSDDKFYVKSDGGFYAKETSQIDGNLKLKDPTANDHAATKAYVDKAISELKKLILKK
ncbi:hyaluronoglucosaminidase [Streptococcus equi]|uniref:Putative phage hyaluronidase n=2 Tax=Streptococcus equi TaxID=1336 RepID=C0M9W4_STRE4|nr:hyaluronoglucosaminidase [Streptococcus equi]QBX15195.1 hyaluronate lyase [Streptococcus phage Javan177]QBX15374.1 hyaluronate lyase [Streptococcus phage Javan183]QBX15391.1 hyaluronate lyase [Streptococcus phage Javan185]QBX15487.1 hyaluronate lyase [Streptococcus phage Javan189]QBX24365.1 hyaluronate lyase [Streptococcus phage Javan184]QBX24419.1 hyaluronate lyase [Streptococcus phage Javan186]QBX24436.1 hyaluronate lyase [Streptococcus phage Javan188]QBX24600.1 hyaluronate lyase [Stre